MEEEIYKEEVAAGISVGHDQFDLDFTPSEILSNGRKIYVADGNGRVYYFDFSRDRLEICASYNKRSETNDISGDCYFTIDSENIYIIKENTSKIKVFSRKSTKQIATINIKDPILPKGICCDAAHVYIADIRKNQILVFNKVLGKFEHIFTISDLKKPEYVAADDDGLYVIDLNGGKRTINIYKKFKLVGLIDCDVMNPCKIAAHSNKIYIPNYGTNEIYKYDVEKLKCTGVIKIVGEHAQTSKQILGPVIIDDYSLYGAVLDNGYVRIDLYNKRKCYQRD
jgi:DNA-binding beta-propeller fold protein YncE